jgi:hypothetical protein
MIFNCPWCGWIDRQCCRAGSLFLNCFNKVLIVTETSELVAISVSTYLQFKVPFINWRLWMIHNSEKSLFLFIQSPKKRARQSRRFIIEALTLILLEKHEFLLAFCRLLIVVCLRLYKLKNIVWRVSSRAIKWFVDVKNFTLARNIQFLSSFVCWLKSISIMLL